MEDALVKTRSEVEDKKNLIDHFHKEMLKMQQVVKCGQSLVRGSGELLEFHVLDLSGSVRVRTIPQLQCCA